MGSNAVSHSATRTVTVLSILREDNDPVEKPAARHALATLPPGTRARRSTASTNVASVAQDAERTHAVTIEGEIAHGEIPGNEVAKSRHPARRSTHHAHFSHRIEVPSGDLIPGQCMDLLDALDLTDREREAVRHRLEGRTLEESGELLGVSAACVHLALAGLRRRLPESLAGMEALMIPGRVPHYGWQEVYLDSLRSRPTGEI